MKGVSFFMLPVIAGHLEPAEYGQLDVLLTLMNWLGLIAGLGIVEACYRYVGVASDREEQHAIIANAYLLAASCALLILVVSLPLLPVLCSVLPGALNSKQILLAIVALVLSATSAVTLAWLRILGKAKLFCSLTVTKAFLHAGLTWILLEWGYRLEAVLWSSLVSSGCLALATFVFQYKTSGVVFHWKWIRSLLVYGSPLVISSTCVFLVFGSERWFLAAHTDTASLGIYGIAMQFAMVVAIASEPYLLWWFPKRFSLLSESQLQANANYASLGVMVTAICAVGISLVGPLVIKLLFPPSYHEAGTWLPWLCLIIALKQSSHILNLGCYTGHSTKLPTVLNAVIAAIGLPTYFVLIDTYGLAGLICASLAIYGLRSLLFIYFSQGRLKLPYPWPILGCQLLAVSLISVCIVFQLHLVAGAFTIGFGILNLIWIKNTFLKNDYSWIRRFTSNHVLFKTQERICQ